MPWVFLSTFVAVQQSAKNRFFVHYGGADLPTTGHVLGAHESAMSKGGLAETPFVDDEPMSDQ